MAPPMTSASELPQPRAKPKSEAAADVQRQEDGAGSQKATATGGQLAERELQAQVEEQQDEPERGNQLQVLRMLDQLEARCLGPEQDARAHEEGDRGQTYSPTEPGEDAGGEQRAPERD